MKQPIDPFTFDPNCQPDIQVEVMLVTSFVRVCWLTFISPIYVGRIFSNLLVLGVI